MRMRSASDDLNPPLPHGIPRVIPDANASQEGLTPARLARHSPGQSFVSSEYGYEVTLPQGWTAAPTTQQWDGGDVVLTADYADRFVAPDGTVVFALGRPVEEPWCSRTS